MNKQKVLKVGLPIVGGLVTLVLVHIVYAFQVPPLPEDNLLQNPWFRDADNPNIPSLDHWVNVNDYWTLSQKISNPAPDLNSAAKCESNVPTYCGTAAKLSADDGNAQVGVDSYLYQVVAANPAHTQLKFSTHWVTHYVDPFEVNIYGSESANGPWTWVWKPLQQVVLTLITPPPGHDTSWLWIEMTSWTPPVETELAHGYAFYKVEIRANIPEPAGFKITGIYFATDDGNGPPQTPPPQQTKTPTPLVTGTPPPPTSTQPAPPPVHYRFDTFLPVVVK